MKNILVILLVFITGSSLSENTIIAVVNENPISMNSVQDKLIAVSSNKEKIEIINNQIDIILQLQKANILKINPTEENINSALFEIAENNNLSIDELLNYDEIEFVKQEISERLSILYLQSYITQDLEYPKDQILSECSNNNLIKDQKQIKIAQIIISEVDSDSNDPKEKNILIKSFLNKLSEHISKGASFEAFSKLHSQHPSYKDGGVTEWLTVNNPTLEMLDSLQINEVSKIYSTAFGLAIAIKIDERFISSKLKECEERVVYKNAETYYANWLENLRDEAFIEIYYDKL